MTEAQLALLMALADLVKEIPLPTHGDGSAMRRRINYARRRVHEEAAQGRSIQGAPELPTTEPPIDNKPNSLTTEQRLLLAVVNLVAPSEPAATIAHLRERVVKQRDLLIDELYPRHVVRPVPPPPVDHDPTPDEISVPEVEMPSTTTVFVQIGAWCRGITTAQARILRDELTQKFPLPPPGIPRHKNYVWLSDEAIASRPTGKVVWINPGDGKAIVSAPNSQPFTVWHEDELRKLAADVGDLVLPPPPPLAPGPRLSKATLHLASNALRDQYNTLKALTAHFPDGYLGVTARLEKFDAARNEIEILLQYAVLDARELDDNKLDV